jgi:hypothetical protein
MTTERASEVASRLTCAYIERAETHRVFTESDHQDKEKWLEVAECISAMYKKIFAAVMEGREH